MKTNLGQLIRAHYDTLVAYPSGKRSNEDYALFWGAPAVVLLLCVALGATLPEGASMALLTTAGVLAAFFFGVMLQLAQRAMDWADRRPATGADTTWQAQFLQQIAANAGYAGLISLLVATVFVGVLMATAPWLLIGLSSLGLALAIHLALLVAMVLTRIYGLTTDRLLDAETGATGATITHLNDHKSDTG